MFCLLFVQILCFVPWCFFPTPILMLKFIVFLVNEGASCCRVFGLLFRGVLKISWATQNNFGIRRISWATADLESLAV
jgi:hypothetical protein